MKPCLKCGEPSPESYCAEHTFSTFDHKIASARARGYDTAWDKLSLRARKAQPFCSDCGGTDDLQADHLPSAWERKAAGRPLRLSDVDVVCGPCNLARGTSRPGSERAQTHGRGAIETSSGPVGKAQSRLIMRTILNSGEAS